MRTIIKTRAYDDAFDSLSKEAQEKVDYVMNILIQNKVVSTRFVKKLKNTEYYEMRISLDNEYRFILFPVDNKNIIEAQQVIVLNGFLKKSTKDYKRQLIIADNIMKTLSDEE